MSHHTYNGIQNVISGSRPMLPPSSSKPSQRHRCSTVAASSKAYVGSLVANDLKFAVVIARFNDLVTKLLLEGALESIDRHGGNRDDVDVSNVNDTFSDCMSECSPCMIMPRQSMLACI